MTPRHLLAALTVAACLAPATTTAQNAYRCGDTYSQQPCAGGKVIDAADPRSADQRAQTDAAARRDARAATAMEKSRLTQEAQFVPARASATIASERPAKPAKSELKRAGKPAHFTAISPRQAAETKVKAKAKNKKRKKKTASRKAAAKT